MRPVDPRMMQYARSTRTFLAITVVLGVVTALLVIAQARLLSGVIVDVTSKGATWSDVATAAALLAGVFGLRALIAWATDAAAVRTAARAKQELRGATLEHVLALGPAGPAGTDPAGTAALITRGVDALDGYFAKYLPQLVLAVIVPIAVLLTVLGQDILSTVIIAVTLPIIPVFMALIGMYTKAKVDRQWATLASLTGHFLDLVSGLPTLKAFGRAKGQVEAIRAIGDRYRSSTMGVLRISFLSSLALELLATLSVALVAVSVGLRLAEGQIEYSAALFILVLAPEAYLPLRLVGQHFHAAAEGLGAADRMFTMLETAPVAGGTALLPSGPVTIVVEGARVSYPEREQPALDNVTFTARPGTITAIVGSSGGGKSTLLSALLGFMPVEDGRIAVASDASVDESLLAINSLDLTSWRSRISWLPQRARLVTSDLAAEPTLAEVVRMGRSDATDDDILEALREAGLAREVEALPDGIHTRLAADGSGLSVGQAQRLALARTLVSRADVVLLDEPTAALDIETESAVVQAMVNLAQRGATVIAVAHRPALVEVSDQIVRIERERSEYQASAGERT